MKAIKGWFKKQGSRFSDIARKYTATLILTALACGFLEYLSIRDTYVERNDEYVLIFLLMAVIGTFFTESVLRNRKSKEATITGYILSGFFAFLWVIIAVMFQSDRSLFNEYYFYSSAFLYALVPTSLSFIALIKDSGLAFEQYLLRVIFSVIRLVIILLILNAGLIFILYLFSTLIASIQYVRWVERLEILLVALLYVPYGLSCLIDKSEPEQTRFAKNVVLYALMPLHIASMGIVYIYMGKLVVTWDFPSNQVFPICALLFAFGFLVWTMAYAYTKRDPSLIYHKIIRYMKYIFAPLILLEIYAISVRISDCGWTILRYWAVIFIALQVIYIAWEPLINLVRLIFKQSRVHYAEHYEWILYIVCAFAFFGLIIPWTCAERVEAVSQEARFDKNYSALKAMHELNRTWTPEEYQQVAKYQYDAISSRSVLRRNVFGTQYLALNYNVEEMDRILKMDSEHWKVEQKIEPDKTQNANEKVSESIYYSGGFDEKSEGLPVEDYKRVYTVEATYAYDDPSGWTSMAQITINYGKDHQITIDLTPCMSALIQKRKSENELIIEDPNAITPKNDQQKQEFTDDIYKIPVDNGMLIITEIAFMHQPTDNTFSNLNLVGYILTE